MIRILQRILFAIVAVVAGADFIWARAGHFAIDERAYLRLGFLALCLFGLGLLYDRRRDRRIGAMLLGTSFLCAFSAAASVLNYLLLTHHGARIDDHLAAIDRAMGVNWVSLIIFMAAHPLFNRVLFVAYGLLLPQIALLVPVLAWKRPLVEVYRFCLALAVGAMLTIAVWAVAPSFGAFSVYHLPSSLTLDLALDAPYARALIALLRDGPGFITPSNLRGLIGFPSYHAILALLVIRYAWPVRSLRWPALVLNVLVLVATPIQGGHHVIDILAALPVTLLALGIVSAAKLLNPSAFADMVNAPPKFTLARVKFAVFRAASAQNGAMAANGIKPTLSRFP